MNTGHYPVLLKEVLEAFSLFDPMAKVQYFDGTFGRGGHYQVIKSRFKDFKAVVMDQDSEALSFAQSQYHEEIAKGDLVFHCKNFSNFSKLKLPLFDMMLLDLGVSSPQIDQPYRGFSFYHEGPLDMRMDLSHSVTAELIVNTYSESELNDLFRTYGEVHRPYRVTRALVHDRKSEAFKTTRQLASLIERVDGWRQKGQHPATKYFMALRLAVNQELEVLNSELIHLMNGLKPGGRLCVITFHSLEDRIVKNWFKKVSELGKPVYKKVIVPTDEECALNPRSRSAKLRIFERNPYDV